MSCSETQYGQLVIVVLNLCVQLEVENWRRVLHFVCSGSIELCPPSDPQMTSQHYSIHIVSISVKWLILLQSIPTFLRQWKTTKYLCFRLGRWSLSTLDQCTFQKVKAIRFCRKVSVPSSTLAATSQSSPECKCQRRSQSCTSLCINLFFYCQSAPTTKGLLLLYCDTVHTWQTPVEQSDNSESSPVNGHCITRHCRTRHRHRFYRVRLNFFKKSNQCTVNRLRLQVNNTKTSKKGLDLLAPKWKTS